MNRTLDVGENLAIVLVVGLTVVTPLVFTGWLLNYALSLPFPKATLQSPPESLREDRTLAEWTQAVSEKVSVTVGRSFWGASRH
jgi:hypothetical protein